MTDDSHVIGDATYTRPSLRGVAGLLKDGFIEIHQELSPARDTIPADPIFGNSLPFQFAYWGKVFYGKQGAHTVGTEPSAYIISCSNATLVAPDGCVLLNDTVLVDLNIQFVRAHLPESQFRRQDGHLWLRDGETERRPGSYFLGFTPAVHNYAHWITECLPFWVYYAQNLKKTGTKLVVSHLEKFHLEALDLLEIAQDDLMVASSGRYLFEQFLVPSQVALWSPPGIVSSAADAVFERAMQGRTPSTERYRVYLSRSDATTRRLLNEAVIMTILDRYGFHSIRCSELSFREQVLTMAASSVVIGSHGAALGNVVFCRPGTQVLELFPEYCVQPHFRALCARASLSYGYVLGTSFEHENSRVANNAWDGDYVIDPEILEAAIRRVLGDGTPANSSDRYDPRPADGGKVLRSSRRGERSLAVRR